MSLVKEVVSNAMQHESILLSIEYDDAWALVSSGPNVVQLNRHHRICSA
jgi:hypothetical protein